MPSNIARARQVRLNNLAEKRESQERREAAEKLVAEALDVPLKQVEFHALGFDGRPIVAVWQSENGSVAHADLYSPKVEA